MHIAFYFTNNSDSGSIDGLYISIKYWNRGKVAAVVTAFCVIVGMAASSIVPAL